MLRQQWVPGGGPHACVAGARGTLTRCPASWSPSPAAQVIVVGAGHNGIVAATLLARQGLKVEVFEEKDMAGGACRTEYPFAAAPGLGQSTG